MEKTNHIVYLRDGTGFPQLERESVALVLTSPPYPMIEMWDSGFGEQDSEIEKALEAVDGRTAFERMHALLDAVWAECERVMIPGGFLCVNIGDATRTLGDGFRLYPNHARVIEGCGRLGLESLPAVIWRKQTNAPNKFMGSGMLPAGAYVTLEHEYVLVFRKGGKRSFDAAGKQRRRRSAFFWEERNEWFSDLWWFKGTRQELGDGAQRARSGAFPFELAYRLILMYSLQGDLVLDPFLGTGTTTAAGIACARSSVGYERDAGLKAAIAQTAEEAVALGNTRAAARVAAHNEFLAQRARDGKPARHANAAHGFGVMTTQERDLELPITTDLRELEVADGFGADGFGADGFGLEATHERLGANENSVQSVSSSGRLEFEWSENRSPQGSTGDSKAECGQLDLLDER